MNWSLLWFLFCCTLNRSHFFIGLLHNALRWSPITLLTLQIVHLPSFTWMSFPRRVIHCISENPCHEHAIARPVYFCDTHRSAILVHNFHEAISSHAITQYLQYTWEMETCFCSKRKPHLLIPYICVHDILFLVTKITFSDLVKIGSHKVQKQNFVVFFGSFYLTWNLRSVIS